MNLTNHRFHSITIHVTILHSLLTDDLTRKELTLVAAYANTEGSDNVIMKSTTTPSMLSCAYECLKDSDCKSILVEKAKQQMGDLSYKCHIIDGKTFYSSKTTSETFYFIAKKDALDFLGNTELDGANEMSSEIANND